MPDRLLSQPRRVRLVANLSLHRDTSYIDASKYRGIRVCPSRRFQFRRSRTSSFVQMFAPATRIERCVRAANRNRTDTRSSACVEVAYFAYLSPSESG